MTIGKKIGLGFALILAILLFTGAYAIISMRSASDGANALSEDYVKEFSIAAKIQDHFANVRLAIRSYGFTGEEKYLAEGRASMAELDKEIKQLGELASRTERLHVLKESYSKSQSLKRATSISRIKPPRQ